MKVIKNPQSHEIKFPSQSHLAVWNVFEKESHYLPCLFLLEEIRGLSENLDFSLKIPGFFKKRDCLQNLTNVRSSSSIWMCRISNICFDFSSATNIRNSTHPNR